LRLGNQIAILHAVKIKASRAGSREEITDDPDHQPVF
jgi:hypothetical protein